MDPEMEGPIDDLEALLADEGEELLGDAIPFPRIVFDYAKSQ